MTDEFNRELTDDELEIVVGGSDRMRITKSYLRQIIHEELAKLDTKAIDEVYSEKQRKWACAQIDNPTSLTKAQAKEMCSASIKKDT